MKINSINNSFNYNLNKPSFKHTAVPYPEYENAYNSNYNNDDNKISILVKKISELFNPQVSKQADVIKNNIDEIYDNKSPKAHLISIFA